MHTLNVYRNFRVDNHMYFKVVKASRLYYWSGGRMLKKKGGVMAIIITVAVCFTSFWKDFVTSTVSRRS
jgi:hypothetical protein